MSKTPDWIEQARKQWSYYGQKRPDFALEPAEGQESVWDYPRPPALVRDQRLIEVFAVEQQIASTRSAFRVLETASPPTFYLPPDDIDMSFLQKAGGGSMCEWKGKATYWDIITPEKQCSRKAWSYEDPFEEFKAIAGYLSFYPDVLACFLDGERVTPQPGGFYGGWLTSEIVGPVKGEGPETML